MATSRPFFIFAAFHFDIHLLADYKGEWKTERDRSAAAAAAAAREISNQRFVGENGNAVILPLSFQLIVLQTTLVYSGESFWSSP